MRKYFGWEFKPALTAAIHKMASDLDIKNVVVNFVTSVPTAAINRYGHMMITNIKDDAVLTQADLSKFTGFALHELLHRKWTNFDMIDTRESKYLLALHNGLEDAWIENQAVALSLTGNTEGLLSQLIDTMATKAVAEVSDWADPRQYPFALAVYARKHGQVVVPLAQGLRPIFDQACLQLGMATSTADTWAIAKWVYKQINALDDAPPSDNPPDQGEGDQQGDQQGDKPVGKATNPTNKRGKGDVEPRSTEPSADLPEGAVSEGSTCDSQVKEQGYHVRGRKWTITI